MHFFLEAWQTPHGHMQFPMIPRGFPMISYKAWGLWLDVFSLWCPSTGFWITSWATRWESDGWETTKGGARWWHGGALIQSFHRFTTKKNNEIFRSCGCSCCIGTSKMVLFKIDRSRWRGEIRLRQSLKGWFHRFFQPLAICKFRFDHL